ncbi:MAG: hypothetical protein JW795_14700 [Chitinivibrionales bacterium]|nr:hypothetical protein [Chitinivibrionales bacterium]
MKSKLSQHLLSIVLVTVVVIACATALTRASRSDTEAQFAVIAPFLKMPSLDLDDPLHRTLLGELIAIYYPDRFTENSALIAKIDAYRQEKLKQTIEGSTQKESLTTVKLFSILRMYLKFLCVYGVVMLCTYYGVLTLGVWTFVRKKQHVYGPHRTRLGGGVRVKAIAGSVGKAVWYGIAFSPAYVIAYSLKTELAVDSLFFMILLGIVSNGLLITYSKKFYTFLVNESRKGYVETGRAKNLADSYQFNTANGISIRSILKPIKRFEGHVFDHIFQNAKNQYRATMKEQASFLITGLIIIEMALNIHGNLNYELLQQLLYKNYTIIACILLCIFYTVKATEMFTDVLIHQQMKKYANNE